MAEVQEGRLDHIDTCEAFVHSMSANIPFAITGRMTKPSVSGAGKYISPASPVGSAAKPHSKGCG